MNQDIPQQDSGFRWAKHFPDGGWLSVVQGSAYEKLTCACQDTHHICGSKVIVNLFFDGTGKTKYTDEKTFSQTNIARLADACKGSEDPVKTEDGWIFKYYIQGVGTPFEKIGETTFSLMGKAFAKGFGNRIGWAYTLLLNAIYAATPKSEKLPDRLFKEEDAFSVCKELNINDGKSLKITSMSTDPLPWNYDPQSEEREKRPILHSKLMTLATLHTDPAPANRHEKIRKILINVFGFSRGAAEARVFVNRLINDWAPDKKLAGVIEYEVNFMGLFDTVSSVGIPDSARAGKTAAQIGNYRGPLDPEKTLEIFIGAGWFRPAKTGYVAHPTALTGIESLLVSEPGTADEVIDALLSGLVQSGEIARAFTIVQWLEHRPSAVSGVVRSKVEEHLLQKFMTDKGYDARRAFDYLAEHSVSAKPAFRLIRAMKPSRGHGALYGIEFWRPPTISADQTAEITASTEAREVARNVVTEILPNDSIDLYSAGELVPFFQQFGWNFETEFSTAAAEALTKYDGHARPHFLVEAALLSGASNFAALTDAVLIAGDIANKLWNNNAEGRRQGDQAEIDADYASHLVEEGSELFSPIERARDLIVAARRRAEGWNWLDAHPRRPDLLWAWANSINRGTKPAEFAALAAACTTSRRPLWQALAGPGDQKQLRALLSEARAAPVEEIRDWSDQAVKLATTTEWKTIAMPIIANLPLAHRMTLATIDLRGEDHADRLSSLPSILSTEEQEVRDICVASIKGESWTGVVTVAHRAALRELARNGSSYFKRASTIALAVLKENIDEFTARLRASEENEDRQTALFAILQTRTDTSAAALSALDDPDYRVRRLALQIVAALPEPGRWPSILRMAADPSAPVRAVCAEIIGREKHIDGVPTLVSLLDDRRDRRPSSLPNASWRDHHVARQRPRRSVHSSLVTRPSRPACRSSRDAAPPSTNRTTSRLTITCSLLCPTPTTTG